MDNLFVRLQNQEISKVIIPTNVTPTQVLAVSLMRTAYFGLTNIIKSDSIDQFKNDDSVIIIDMGGGEYDSINNVRTREDGSTMSSFGIIWNEMKEFYSEEMQQTFDEVFVKPAEEGNVISMYIDKLLVAKSNMKLTYALNAVYRILKVWTL